MRAVVCTLTCIAVLAACAADGSSGPSSAATVPPTAKFALVPAGQLARVQECRIESSRSGGSADKYVVSPSVNVDTVAISLHSYRGLDFHEEVPFAGGFPSFVELLVEGTNDLLSRQANEPETIESATTLSIELDFVQVRCAVSVTCSPSDMFARIESSNSLRKALDLIGSRMGKDYRIWDEPGPDKDMINFHGDSTTFQPGSAR